MSTAALCRKGIMSNLTTQSALPIALPAPCREINIRPGAMDDLPFLDRLQKIHTHQVGWMPTKQFEGKIKLGHVIIAEEKTTTDYTDCTDLNSESVKSVQS